jgi:hypothetical protein
MANNYGSKTELIIDNTIQRKVGHEEVIDLLQDFGRAFNHAGRIYLNLSFIDWPQIGLRSDLPIIINRESIHYIKCYCSYQDLKADTTRIHIKAWTDESMIIDQLKD